MEALNDIQNRIPELSERINSIQTNLDSKRWYELGEALQQFLALPQIQGQRLLLFDKLVEKNHRYLDVFHYAHLVLLASEEQPNLDATIQFLQEISQTKYFEDKPAPKALLDLRVVDVLTEKKEYEDALKLLNEIEKKITEQTPLEVRSAFHRSQSLLDKARQDYDSFYQHAFLFLSTSKIERDAVVAYDLCIAALFSNAVCSFGELAAHPILSSLENGEYAWLRELILLLDKGDPNSSITEFEKTYLPIIQSQPEFASHLDTIRLKLHLAVFLEVIFQRDFGNRTFSFEEIAHFCQINIDQVELLVLKALSSEIIKGTIDEVEQKIVVKWCKPKALGRDRLQHLKSQIDQWIKIVHEQMVALTCKTES